MYTFGLKEEAYKFGSGRWKAVLGLSQDNQVLLIPVKYK